MANMSYCRFENTFKDMNDCVNELESALELGKTFSQFHDELSKDEKYFFNKLLISARDFIGQYEELVEAQNQEDY